MEPNPFDIIYSAVSWYQVSKQQQHVAYHCTLLSVVHVKMDDALSVSTEQLKVLIDALPYIDTE